MITNNKILVVGSANMDMVVKSAKIPRMGETVLGGVFSQHEGGKGANQAMAAKTLFEDTVFCAGMGDDAIGREYIEYMKSKNLDTSLVKIFKGAHTGVALITVAKEGQNIITVAPGANLLLSPDDMKAIDFSKFSHVAFQLENKLETVAEGLKLAKAAGCVTVLTPAPARLLDDAILKNVDFLLPNEIEILQVQRGFTSINTAAESLLKKGVANVLVTLGERGCVLFNGGGERRYNAFSVRPIDTVGAGDCFTGALLAGFRMFDDIDSAIKFATAAAALKVTKVGAQSYANLKDVLKLMKSKTKGSEMSYMDNIKTFAKAAKIPALICFFWCISGAPLSANEIEISKERLVDKIKGGWAGQFIGCTYGGPTEFKYKFAMIPDDVEIKWHKNAAKWQINANGEFGGLYDDVYLDITFMDVFEKQGFDAPRRAFKKAVSEGKYHLWAANYAARLDYMELADADKPVSWETNTNSNDIDFQIEADFAGLMSPALPRAALRFADKVGRAINGGEGYYCGAFIATMYSLAFVYDDIEKIIKESMKILPQESNTYEIAKDIMQWHGENPKDWKYTWKKLDEKHVKASKNSAIYAPFNMAYILVGLVYGEKDFGKTIDISTRCGLDSDCNPSNAAGILGAIIGYSQIPEKFMEPLKPYEETINFSGTSYTMAKTYAVGYSQALKVLKKYGAEISKESVKIKVEMPEPLKLEGEKPNFKFVNNDKIIFDENTASAKRNFNGCGLYITSDWTRNIKERPNSQNDAVESVAEFEIYVDGKLERTSKFFYNEFFKKKSTVHLNYGLTEGAHTLEIRKKKMVDGFKPIQFEIAYYRK